MTQLQKDLLAKIKPMLAEHFDAFVLITQVDRAESDGNLEDVDTIHSGGFHNAIGLMAAAHNHYLNSTGEEDELEETK